MGSANCDCSDTDCSISSEKLDAVLTLLADRTRRHILYCLMEDDRDVVDFETVCEYLVDANSELSPDEKHRVKAKLHHSALPKLKAAGIIEHDTRSETIRLRDDRLIETYLSKFSEYETC